MQKSSEEPGRGRGSWNAVMKCGRKGNVQGESNRAWANRRVNGVHGNRAFTGG